MMANTVRLKQNCHLIAMSANNKQVYANLMSKSLTASVSGNPHLLRLAEEAVATMTLTGKKVQNEYCLDHPIGRSHLIETKENDAIFFARQTKTGGFTRFVKNRDAVPTDRITVTMIEDEDGAYEITTIWIGRKYPPTPDDPEATAESAAFWADHAVVYNGQPLISSTLTKTSPY